MNKWKQQIDIKEYDTRIGFNSKHNVKKEAIQRKNFNGQHDIGTNRFSGETTSQNGQYLPKQND